MERPAVELSVGGQTYRVRASADESELHRLADLIDLKLREVAGPDRALAPNQLVLVAISLAHELEEARAKTRELEENWRAKLQNLLERIDRALEESGDDDDANATSDEQSDRASPR